MTKSPTGSIEGSPTAPTGGSIAVERATLIPDANFSRNVTFHVIQDDQGEHLWVGRYLHDLVEVIAECYPDGLLVEIDGISYVLTVAPAPKG